MLLLGAALAAGCAPLGFSADEAALVESSAADARLMARTWAARSAAEQDEFLRENAARWTLFADLAHGRPASLGDRGDAPAGAAPAAAEEGGRR